MYIKPRYFEKICGSCKYLTVRYKDKHGGWGYCQYNQSWFPNKNCWIKRNGKPQKKNTTNKRKDRNSKQMSLWN